jgi:hypothetical protein
MAAAEKGSPFYENCQPITGRKIWVGRSVAVFSAAI